MLESQGVHLKVARVREKLACLRVEGYIQCKSVRDAGVFERGTIHSQF